MVIRWENGKEICTEIALQRRIAERRQWTQSIVAEAARKPSPKTTSTEKKSTFTNFALTDFKKNASGTTWRSRNQLGTAVTQKINTTKFEFKSWAFGHKPEMHIQDINQHGHAANDYQAIFFVRVDQHSLCYGFRVARPDNKGNASTDWDAFSGWLTQHENEQMLHTLSVENNLSVCNRTSPSSGTLMASDDGWRIEKIGQQPDKKTLTAYINDTPETEPFDLELTATIDKNDPVACGPDIAENIAQLFTRLLPLYQAAVAN